MKFTRIFCAANFLCCASSHAAEPVTTPTQMALTLGPPGASPYVLSLEFETESDAAFACLQKSKLPSPHQLATTTSTASDKVKRKFSFSGNVKTVGADLDALVAALGLCAEGGAARFTWGLSVTKPHAR
ncbi:MAG: hypothetical protein V4582_21975 [Pseudomonadota bacterium]